MKKKAILPLILAFFMTVPGIIEAAQISFYIGNVKLYRNGSKMRPTMGKILRPGDMLITGSRSTVDIRYNDGSRISVKSNSKVKFGSKSIKNSRHIALIRGNLTGKFNKVFRGQRSHKIVTPTVVCAVRGTEFKVSVSRTGKSRVDLKDGKLQLDNPSGREYLNRNQQMQADIAKPPRVKPITSKISDWQRKEDNKLKSNPKKISNSYKRYMNQFSSRSSTQNREVKNHDQKIKSAKTKENLDWIEKKIDESEDKIENDLLLNETSIASIDDILQDYKRRKARIYKIFYRIKRESNKVRQQQERNYRELQAVRRAYLEAKKKILNKFNQDKKNIKKMDMNRFKPSFEFKK